MIKTLVLGASTALMLTAGAAQAATPQVKYDDLDLGRPADARAYKTRMARAIESRCERAATSGSNYAGQKLECERSTAAALMSSLPDEVRSVYVAALNGQASDALTRARLASSETAARAR